jgi:hypothetical protein
MTSSALWGHVPSQSRNVAVERFVTRKVMQQIDDDLFRIVGTRPITKQERTVDDLFRFVGIRPITKTGTSSTTTLAYIRFVGIRPIPNQEQHVRRRRRKLSMTSSALWGYVPSQRQERHRRQRRVNGRLSLTKIKRSIHFVNPYS